MSSQTISHPIPGLGRACGAIERGANKSLLGRNILARPSLRGWANLHFPASFCNFVHQISHARASAKVVLRHDDKPDDPFTSGRGNTSDVKQDALRSVRDSDCACVTDDARIGSRQVCGSRSIEEWPGSSLLHNLSSYPRDRLAYGPLRPRPACIAGRSATERFMV